MKMPTLNYIMTPRNLVWLMLALVTASCTNERPVYQGAEYYKNLEVPPDLTEPDTSSQLRIPKPTEEALQRFRDNNKLETVITPKFDGVRTVTYAGNSWIEVDNNADYVWPRLIEFWEKEGIPLAEVRPLLGYMETQWVEHLQAEQGFFSRLLNSVPDQKEKFRVRVERFDNDAKTRLYVSVTRIERVFNSNNDDEYIWVTLPNDIETEREIISRMAIFAGLPEESTEVLLANYRPYSSLIETNRSDDTSFVMLGSMDFVWRRAVRALDRMDMHEIKEQPQINTISYQVTKPDEKALKVEGDELAQSSWMVNLFNDVNASVTSLNYQLEFTERGDRVLVEVKDAAHPSTTDGDGDVSGPVAVEQMRDMLIKHME